MKKIGVFIGLITLLSACAKKHNVQPDDPNLLWIKGVSYPTVTIGNQVWTTVNYSGPGGYHSADHSQYGDYYTLQQAGSIILPSEWRVPTMQDYIALLTNYGNNKNGEGLAELDGSEVPALLSTSAGWTTTPTNRSGFNAQPNGMFQVIGQTATYQTEGQAAYFMTSNRLGLSDRFGLIIKPMSAGVGASAAEGVYTVAYSLRFVRDK
jgi:uncharacterized protein (TIGR02145 family)